MATPRTGNGGAYNIFFTNEVRNALASETIRQGKSFSQIVREAVIPYLMMRGWRFTEKANPSGRGERTDLRASSKKFVAPDGLDEMGLKPTTQRKQREKIEKLDKELNKLNKKIDKRLKEIDKVLAKLGVGELARMTEREEVKAKPATRRKQIEQEEEENLKKLEKKLKSKQLKDEIAFLFGAEEADVKPEAQKFKERTTKQRSKEEHV